MQQILWPNTHDVIDFAPSRAAALARLAAVNVQAYARSRNDLAGAVTRLSPYLTHGLLSSHEVLHITAQRTRLTWQDKFVFELAWRAYFHHTWKCLGDEIWQPQHPPPAPRYAQEMPQDIAQGTTGVPIIDAQVRNLYAVGYLHNHARMWLASYVVHLRKVDWRVGAAWMYAHLLDGDLASNTLSWQWVAGTWTGKPYLFNAENVQRYADIDCSGTAIARSYAALDECARTAKVYAEAPAVREAVNLPAIGGLEIIAAMGQEALQPNSSISGQAWLMHPWSLHLPDTARGQPVIGVWIDAFHRQYPWSAKRYSFVQSAMQAQCDVILMGSAQQIAQQLAGLRLHAVPTLHADYAQFLQASQATLHCLPTVFVGPPCFKKSFSSYWNTISRGEFPS
jgi:deoxyribodipyrimidine photo-lyase